MLIPGKAPGMLAVLGRLLDSDLAEKPNRPPSMCVMMATGENVETLLVTSVTEAGLIDSGYFDPRMRQELLLRCPQLKPYLDEPWTWTD
jgi:hypothetical protein